MNDIVARYWYVHGTEGYYTSQTVHTNVPEYQRMNALPLLSRVAVLGAKTMLSALGYTNVRAVRVTVRKKLKEGGVHSGVLPFSREHYRAQKQAKR